MTLYRQLLFFTLIILICLGIGLWIGDHRRTRDFLTDQLESHAQDTATSLGLSLSTLAKGTDVPVMEAMINALFDRGFYQRILLTDIEGKVLVERSSDATIKGVPDWFIRLTPLKAPQAEALIMHGWQQTGLVKVESHPGYAYKALWESALAEAQWCAAAAVAVALLGGLGLSRLLSPLRRVEEQAQALCDRKFLIQEPLPRTRELRRVVMAMNRMTERIRALFDEQTAIAETLRQRTYQDTLTGLGNRRFLEAQAKTKLMGRATARGVLLLFHIRNLQAINQQQGYLAGDQLISEAAASIRQACAKLPEVIAARLAGGDFALLLPNADASMASQLADDILADLCPPDSQQAGQPLPVVCGGAVYDQEAALGALLSQADAALTNARYRNDNRAVIVPLAGDPAPAAAGRNEWQTMLEDFIARGSVIVYSQPVVSRGDRNLIMHHELLARMRDDLGNHLSISRFLPLAEQSGLMPALDQLILEHIFSLLPLEHFAPQRVTINLSPLSLADSGFIAWFSSHLRRCGEAGLAIQVEFPEFRAVRHLHLIKSFAQEIRPMGHAIGIDHFGQAFSHFGYLKSLLPDYVKIDRAITNELQNVGDDSHFFVNALCAVAHSLDIKVVVEGIETEQQWQTVTSLPIDAVQGFLIRRPELALRK